MHKVPAGAEFQLGLGKSSSQGIVPAGVKFQPRAQFQPRAEFQSRELSSNICLFSQPALQFGFGFFVFTTPHIFMCYATLYKYPIASLTMRYDYGLKCMVVDPLHGTFKEITYVQLLHIVRLHEVQLLHQYFHKFYDGNKMSSTLYSYVVQNQ